MSGDRAEFSVYQFFRDDSCERVFSFVTAAVAVPAFKRLIESVGAQVGNTVRVIVTDGGDFTNMEWTFAEGITYPPDLAARWKAAQEVGA